jgi:hypothetical protein
VDFCDDPRCLSEEVSRSDLPTPHLPTHDILKTRRVLQHREFGNVYRVAMTSLQVSQEAMRNGVDPADVPDRWNAPSPTDAHVDAGKDKEEQQNGEAETTSSDDEKAQTIASLPIDEGEEQTTEAAKQSPELGKQRPRCIVCNQMVSSPCRYCAECPGMSAVIRILFPASNADSLCRQLVSFRMRVVRVRQEDWKQQSSLDASSGAGTLSRPGK